jgi:phenylacetate-CoA ligase
VSRKDGYRALPLAWKTAAGVDLSRCRSFDTSGTTGVPLTGYFLRSDNRAMNLGWLRAQTLCGLRPRHRFASLAPVRPTSQRSSFHERVGFYPRREFYIGDPPERLLSALRKWRPDILLGYVMSLRLLAEAVVADGRPLPLRDVFHTSAFLDPASRRFLEESFRCRVSDFYGSIEAGCIAWECPTCAGYHIAADMVIVEVLKHGRPAAPGEAGEVVVTNLHSRAMPFIRFGLNDTAVLSERPPVCGAMFPLLERIDGRIDDFLVLPRRGRVAPPLVYKLVNEIPGLARWRIRQDALLHVDVEGEALDRDPADLQAALESNLRRIIPAEVRIDIRIVERIEIPPERKFRVVSSSVGRIDP